MDQEPNDVFNDEIADKENRLHELREEMVQTRSALTEKLETIQNRVQHTMDTAQHAVEDTVHHVQDNVESALEFVNVRKQTESHPWAMVGLAVASGVLLGYCTSKPRKERSDQDYRGDLSMRRPGSAPPIAPTPYTAKDLEPPAPAAPPPPPAKPSLFAEEWNQVKGLAVGVGMALLRDWIKEAAPGISGRIDDIFSSANKKLGGAEVEGPVFETQR